MLKGKSRELPARSLSKNEEPIVPDPWELPSPVPDTSQIPIDQFPGEAHPLLMAGGNPSALRLSVPN